MDALLAYWHRNPITYEPQFFRDDDFESESESSVSSDGSWDGRSSDGREWDDFLKLRKVNRSKDIFERLLWRWYSASTPPPLLSNQPTDSLISRLICYWYSKPSPPLLCEQISQGPGNKAQIHRKKMDHIRRFYSGRPTAADEPAVFMPSKDNAIPKNTLQNCSFRGELLVWVTATQGKLGVVNVETGGASYPVTPGRQAIRDVQSSRDFVLCTTINGYMHSFHK